LKIQEQSDRFGTAAVRSSTLKLTIYRNWRHQPLERRIPADCFDQQMNGIPLRKLQVKSRAKQSANNLERIMWSLILVYTEHTMVRSMNTSRLPAMQLHEAKENNHASVTLWVAERL
jgi:hypothetical protein